MATFCRQLFEHRPPRPPERESVGKMTQHLIVYGTLVTRRNFFFEACFFGAGGPILIPVHRQGAPLRNLRNLGIFVPRTPIHRFSLGLIRPCVGTTNKRSTCFGARFMRALATSPSGWTLSAATKLPEWVPQD